MATASQLIRLAAQAAAIQSLLNDLIAELDTAGVKLQDDTLHRADLILHDLPDQLEQQRQELLVDQLGWNQPPPQDLGGEEGTR